MHRLRFVFLLGWAGGLFAAEATLFDYDRAASLEVTSRGVEHHSAADVRDLTFVGVKAPVKAYLVTPTTPGPHAAILFVHWLGNPATTNRTEFLDEAIALAPRGVISLLVDTMWAEPNWYANRVPEEDFARSVRQVVELRRALDLLLAQPGVDPARVAFVGHDFGAMYGMLASAQDRRACTYVFVAPVPRLVDWFLFARRPADLAAYHAQLAPLAPVDALPALSPASIFFQFASHDKYVSATQATELYSAALPRKQATTYADDHALGSAPVAADRRAWLERELKLR